MSLAQFKRLIAALQSYNITLSDWINHYQGCINPTQLKKKENHYEQ